MNTIASLAAAAFTVAATPAPDDASGHAVIQPRLLIAPNENEVAEVYPRAAWVHGLGGRSSMLCRVQRNRSLADCRLTAEAPEGQGFGQAILASARDWRLSPQKVNGRNTSDGVVKLTVVWIALP